MGKRVEALRVAGANKSYIQAVVDAHTGVPPAEEPYKIDPDFVAEMKQMEPDDKVIVAIQHAEQPKLSLPRVDIDLDSDLPGFTWDAYIERLDAIDERIALFENLQAPIVEFVEANDGVVLSQHWAVNALYAVVPVWLVEDIAARDDVLLVHQTSEPRIQDIYNEANFDDFVGGKPYKLVITADFVPAGKERTIYWSYFWEDLDRDDTDGPCYSCGSGDDLYLFYR